MARSLSFSARLFTVLCCLTGLALAAGCGTGTYKKRQSESLEILEVQSAFIRTLSSQPVNVYNNAGYGISYRRPLVFSDRETTGRLPAGLQYPDASLDPRLAERSRTSPPFLAAASTRGEGWRSTWQAYEFLYQESQNKQLTCYNYFAFVPPEVESQEALQEEILASLQAAFPDAELAWEEVEVDGPDGSKPPWQRLSVTGDMPVDVRFALYGEGGYQPDMPYGSFPCRMDLYVATLKQPLMAEDGGEGEAEGTESESETGAEDAAATRPFTAIVGWRAPLEIADKFKFFTAADAAVGTIVPAIELEDKTPSGGGQPTEEEEPQSETPTGPVLRPRGSQPERPTTPPPSGEDTAGADPEATESPTEPPAAEKPGYFRWNWQEGDRYTARLQYTSGGRLLEGESLTNRYFEVMLDLEMRVTSVVVDGSGNSHAAVDFTIGEIVFERIFSNEAGVVESESSGYAPSLDERIMRELNSLKGQPFEVVLSDRGAVEAMNFSADFQNALEEAFAATEMRFFSRDGFQHVFSQSLMTLPEESLAEGESWETQAVSIGWPVNAYSQLEHTFASHRTVDNGAMGALLDASMLSTQLENTGGGAEQAIPAGAAITVDQQSASGQGAFDMDHGLLLRNRLTVSLQFSFATGDSGGECSMNTSADFQLSRGP